MKKTAIFAFFLFIIIASAGTYAYIYYTRKPTKTSSGGGGNGDDSPLQISVVNLYIDSAIYPNITTELTQYKQDIEAQGYTTNLYILNTKDLTQGEIEKLEKLEVESAFVTCNHCKNKVSSVAKFCSICGNPIDSEE